VPHQSFPPEASLDWQPSRLVMSIHPDEGIVLRFQAKHPGPKMNLQTVEMKFNYQEAFAVRSPDDYETLLWDLMKNDATLNGRQKSVRRCSPSRWVVSVGTSCSRFSALTQFCLLTPISCAG
jgi:glucose-6-phosphate 1-dehydrogenase